MGTHAETMDQAEQWPVGSPRHRSFDTTRPGGSWQVLRWIALALLVLTLIAGPLVGEREGRLGELERAVRTGGTTQVLVESRDLGPDGTPFEIDSGYVTYRLVWREGWQRRFTEVGREVGTGVTTSSSLPRITVPVEEMLRDLDPEVQVTFAEPRTAWSMIGKYQAPAGWAVLPLLAGLLWLNILISGPEPRLATRWAWFWLAFSPAVVLVAPAYLLLGAQGATPGAQRLTGGWALLISVLFLGGVGFAGR